MYSRQSLFPFAIATMRYDSYCPLDRAPRLVSDVCTPLPPTLPDAAFGFAEDHTKRCSLCTRSTSTTPHSRMRTRPAPTPTILYTTPLT